MQGFLVLFLTATVIGQPQMSEDQVREKADQAQAAFKAGDFAEAAASYRELVSALPEVPGLRMNLGLALYLGGRPSEAVEPLLVATQRDPSLAPAWLFLGASLMDTGRPADAVKPLKKYLEAQPGEVKALDLLGDSLLQTGRHEEAVQVYNQRISIDASSPRSWFGLGRCYEAMAGRAFERLNQLEAESGYWFALIAESRLAQQQYSSAFYFLRKALEKIPTLRGVYAAIGFVYRQTGHPDWAEQEEQKEVALGEPDCDRERNACYYLRGNFKDLYESLRSNESAESFYWQVRALNQLAVQSFSKLVELPPSVEAHQFRAEIHRNQGRHWESVSELTKALQLSPEHPIVRRELAVSMYLNRDYDKALQLIQEILAGEPDSAQMNYLTGDILLYQQKAEESVPFLERAVQKEPDYTAARGALGRALMQIGEAEKAIPHLQAALGADDDGSLHFQLARAYQRTGKREQAQTALREYQAIRQRNETQQKQVEEEVKITPP